jgi:hypothetical protein
MKRLIMLLSVALLIAVAMGYGTQARADGGACEYGYCISTCEAQYSTCYADCVTAYPGAGRSNCVGGCGDAEKACLPACYDECGPEQYGAHHKHPPA